MKIKHLDLSVRQHIYTAYKKGQKLLAVLLDPDHCTEEILSQLPQAEEGLCDFIFVGGSLLTGGEIESTVLKIKAKTNLPVVLFPGNGHQITAAADSILLLSLVSGRNPDLLIGKHVESAFALKQSGLEIIPTAYLLVDSGKPTTASYISNSQPIPGNKGEIGAATALAAQQLGMHLAYVDGGSGGNEPVTDDFIQKIHSHTEIPMVVGGGISNPNQAAKAWKAGATVVVVGTALESNFSLLTGFSSARKE